MLDIKNNRQRSQGTGGPLTISSVLSAGVLKWLRGCGIDEVQLRNLTLADGAATQQKGTLQVLFKQPEYIAQSLQESEAIKHH